MNVVFKGRGAKRPRVWVATYLFVLLILFLVGVLENRVDSEGMGFFPLLAATTPWSWFLIGTWDAKIWGSGPQGTHVAIFVTCNVISGAINSFILYLLINWRQKKRDFPPI
jgi:hypothetical protein